MSPLQARTARIKITIFLSFPVAFVNISEPVTTKLQTSEEFRRNIVPFVLPPRPREPNELEARIYAGSLA